jgi:hypothetical protein
VIVVVLVKQRVSRLGTAGRRLPGLVVTKQRPRLDGRPGLHDDGGLLRGRRFHEDRRRVRRSEEVAFVDVAGRVVV